MSLHELTLSEAADKIRGGDLSPVELTDAVLARIAEFDKTINAFVTVTEEAARASAKKAADEIANGRYLGPLHGIPVGLKDLFAVKGVPSTASSAQRTNHIATDNSAVTEKLAEGGAVLVGTNHLHEFAYGALTPDTRNPWNTAMTAGGSSGGTAAALTAGMMLGGIGTDTGGSIRIPAAICGVVGLKPTYGRVSRRGVTPLSWSLDHAGPLARTVRDTALLLGQIAGYDRADAATVDVPVPDYAAVLGNDIRGLRIGVPTNFFSENVDPEITAATEQAVAEMRSCGAVIVPVEIPMADALVPTEWGILVPEASAYHQQTLRATPENYTDETRTFLEAGELMLATDYIKALRVRTRLQEVFRDLFGQIDVLVAPTIAAPAVPLDNPDITWPDGTQEGATVAYVRLSTVGNVTGLPALSVPSGFTSSGLPMGIQIIGRPFDEETVLRVGDAYERATDWNRLAPL